MPDKEHSVPVGVLTLNISTILENLFLAIELSYESCFMLIFLSHCHSLLPTVNCIPIQRRSLYYTWKFTLFWKKNIRGSDCAEEKMSKGHEYYDHSTPRK